MIFLRYIYFAAVLLGFFSCAQNINSRKREQIIETSNKEPLKQESSSIRTKDLRTNNNVKIDSVSIDEIKWYIEEELPSIFDYYNEEKTGEYTTWSSKLFGRCCSNTDLTFNENLFLEITSNVSNKDYPISNISDTEYLTVYAFSPESKVKINIKLDKDNSYFQGEYSNNNLLGDNEIIMNPIRLSLINGYVKSKSLYYKNGRVKEVEIYVNDEYKQSLVLLDTPLVQEIKVNSIFTKNDIITLVPKSYYKGTKYDDICISEIQTNLGKIALPNLNEKFNLMKLMNKGN